MNNRLLRWLARWFLLAGLLGGFAAFAPHAAAAPAGQPATGTVSGKVVSADGVPLPNVKLAAYAEAQSNPNRVAVATLQSDAQGNYTVQVPAGPIWMSFLTQDVLGQSFWGYDNLPITVPAGGTVSNANFVVAIRVVSTPVPAPPTPAPPPPAPVPTPGMPTTGAPAAGPGPLLALAALCLAAGLLTRRAARGRRS